jgi:uncharacterized protein
VTPDGIRLTPFDAVEPEPWRNGGGVTRTLARGDGGRWRVSVAELAGDAEFSRFPGLRRELVRGSGPDFELVIDALPVRVGRGVVRFAGDVAVRSVGAAPGTTVLNVMSGDEDGILTVDEGTDAWATLPEGACAVVPLDDSATVVAGDAAAEVGPLSLAVVRGPGRVRAPRRARIAVIAIPVGRGAGGAP